MKILRYFLVLVLCTAASQLPAQSRADKRFEQFDYAKAIPLYLKYIRKNPSDVEAKARLADSYRLIRDYENAERWYGQVVAAPVIDPENYYFYGQSLMNNGKYAAAVPQLERYLKERGWNAKANNMLESAKNPTQYYTDSASYIIRSVPINTPGPEFAPVIYNGSVVFTSAQNRDKIVYNWTGQAFLDLFASSYNGDFRLGEPQPLGGTVNSRYHEGGATFSPDGQTMYFTRNNFTNGKVGKDEESIVRLKAYKAELTGGRWTNITEFPFNSDDYSVGHPCMDAEGRKIYFISDMPGGAGGTDIYVTRKLGPDEWSEPENLGDEINSSGNEMFPWISSTGVLYYASDGLGGLGGLDIFRVTSVGSQQEEVKNMGFPVNGSHDDFALVIDERTGQGFFASNRTGGEGDDDIYSIRLKQVVEGLVLDAKTGESLSEIMVNAIDGRGQTVTVFSDGEGRFRMPLDRNKEYMVMADGEFYTEARQRLSTVSFDPRTPLEVLLKLEQDMTCEPPYIVDGSVTNDSNETLSGATVRVMPRPFTLEADSTGNFVVNLQPDMEYDIRVEKEGYMDRTYEISTKDMEPGEIPLATMLSGLNAEKDTAMYTIFYDYNGSDIRSQAYRELDEAIGYLKRNPAVKIRLVSHADARGNNYYNNRLSRKRSLRAYEYLVREGVPEDRVEVVWVGESRPVNDCLDGVDCPEDEHQANRRTEIQYAGQVPTEDLNSDEEAVELRLPAPEEGSKMPVIDAEVEEAEDAGEGESEVDSEEGEEVDGEDGRRTLGEAIEEAIEEMEEEIEEVAEEVEDTTEDVVEEGIEGNQEDKGEDGDEDEEDDDEELDPDDE